MNRNKAIVIVGALALSTAIMAAAPAGAAPAVYLDEPFSDSPNTLAEDWFDADIGGRNRISTINDGSDGAGIKVSIPAGSHFGSAMHWQFEDQGISDPDELFFRYYLRIPDGAEHKDRGKLPGPAGLYSGSARNNIKPTSSSPGWSARMFFSPTYDNRDPEHTQLGFYVYHRDQASDNGDLLLWDTQTGTVREDAWYCVEGHVDMNTPGQANGILEGWVDEQLAFYQDDFKFRGTADTGIDIKSFWFDVYYGGTETAPSSYSFDFDSLVLSSERIGCGDNPVSGFRDTSDSIHKSNIEKFAFAEITRGCNPPLNDLYCPDSSVTRGQMAAFLVRALGLPTSSTEFFTDDDGTVFEANINALAASGITKGCSSDGFCPDRSVTRGEMAAFLDRALGLPDTTPDWFDDDNTSIFEGAIDRLASSGITSGCNPPANNNFCPHANVTRGQMASFLSRALSLPTPPPPPPGYIPPEVPTGYDAVVPVGWSMQEVADSQPTGAKIYVASGTHLRQSVVPKTGQQFIGQPGAVMDGLGVTTYAFTGSANSVTIRGIEVKNYTSGTDQGAIHAVGSGWLIDDCNVHDNRFVGVSVRGGSTISNSFIHHNKTHGVYVDGGSGTVVSGNEIAYNNDDQNTPDASNYNETRFAGAKFAATSNVTVKDNHVHDNHGHGFWSHKDNTAMRYESNTIEDNWWAGIFHDNSYAVTITANNFYRNGLKAKADDKFYYGAIQATGPNVTVTNNTVSENHNAVVVIGYGLDEKGLTANNAVVTGNTIINSGNTGLVTNGTGTVFSTSDFDDNDYRYSDTSGRHWVWTNGADYAWDGWQGAGNDLKGSFGTP